MIVEANHPLLYEINTRCWLRELSQRTGAPVTLADVPDAEFARWQHLGFTHIWLMGVWTTGPLSRDFSQADGELQQICRGLLPDFKPQDIGASPYAIAEYKVSNELGGDAGLKTFRQKLLERGMKLLLDFVPNHSGLDHPWLTTQPDLFVQSPIEVPGTFRRETAHGTRWIAHGKDPNFPPWRDTAQFDYRRAETRKILQETLLSIAAHCDGVQCDMAMLLLNDVFQKTWAHLPSLESGVPPSAGSTTLPPRGGTPSKGSEFWGDAISAVKKAHPDFLFLAEVYWGLEARLLSLGFDFTYDKVLYDALVWRRRGEAQSHLLNAAPEFVKASAHFLENHDERRIASIFSGAEHRAAALAVLSLPGMRFLHEGQLTGGRKKIPVQLLRRPAEARDEYIFGVYERLLAALPRSTVRRENVALLKPRAAWPDNPTAHHFIIVQWQIKPPEFDLAVVNLAPHRSQCYAPLSVGKLSDYNWSMRDVLGTENFKRSGDDLLAQGLYLDLPEHGAQLFHFTPI